MTPGESQLARAFTLSTSLVLVIDAGDATIVDANPSLERASGYTRAELIGRRSVDLGLWTDLDARARIWAELRANRCVTDVAVEFLTRGGGRLHARVTCEMFDDGGRPRVLALAQQVRESATADAATADVESYRALFLSAAEGLYRSLPDGGFIDLNPAMARIFGYDSPLQMLREAARSTLDLYADSAHGAWINQELEQRGFIENVRSRVRRRDGSLIWIAENARAVRDAHSGRLLFHEGSVVDITERIEAEARLRQSEALYRILVDNCRDGVFLIQHGKVKFLNLAMAQILGYAVPELLDCEYMELIAPEWRAEQAQRRTARESGSLESQSYELEMLRKDGTRCLVAVRADAVEYEGENASIGTARDVTEERRRQRALAEAERKYRELFEHSVVGLFRTHPDGTLLEANPAIARLLGYDTPAELLGAGRHVSDLYAHPEERDPLLQRIRESGRLERHELQMRRRNGQLMWVELSVHAVGDEQGGVAHFEGSVQDITARREAELRLQQSEARYRNLVEHSQVGVYMMYADCYTYVNQAFAAMFGYSEQELVGANFRLLVPPESQHRQEERYRRRQSGELPTGDYSVVLLRKDGTRVEVVVSAGPVEIDGKVYTSGTIRDVTEQRRFQRELEHNATHDALTGLPNRVLFERELGYRLERAIASTRYEYAVLFLDLDGFKLVNDSLGHAAGDELLLEIARRLRDAFAGEGLVARYGGDEFTVLPEGPCPGFRAEALARRVLNLLGDAIDVHGHQVYSGASVGIVLGHPDYLSPDQILRDADTAMYHAKAAKSGYVVFDDAMHKAARERLRLETDLRMALERGEFRVHYQPIVDLASGDVVGCEALVRWQHPERGLLPPPLFLDAAEESGLIVALDWWVLEQACRQVVAWQRRHPDLADLRININLDERQFAERDLVKDLRAVIERTGVDPGAIALEVTETVFRRGRGGAEEILWALKDLGVMLVVDDFGTGYSSLESFASAPFDALKIDRSFVCDMETNPRHRAIVRTITSLADELGLMLTGEGVETPGQAQLLLSMGCATAQGYLYARPMPAEAMDEVLSVGLQRQWRA